MGVVEEAAPLTPCLSLCFYLNCPKGHQEFCNKVWSQSSVKLTSGLRTGNLSIQSERATHFDSCFLMTCCTNKDFLNGREKEGQSGTTEGVFHKKSVKEVHSKSHTILAMLENTTGILLFPFSCFICFFFYLARYWLHVTQ